MSGYAASAYSASDYLPVELPDGEVRVYPAAPGSGDASPMYVPDALGFQVMVRRCQEDDGMAWVVEIADDPGGVLTVHVRGIENTYE